MRGHEHEDERSIVGHLRSGRAVADARFDRLYDPYLRGSSPIHFTPVAVAMRAAAWLANGGAVDVVDVGSGAGKFCLVGAATTGARFTGVETREALVEASRRLARRLCLSRTQFVHADARTLSFRRFQAFYVFNPFAEAAADPEDWLDPRPPTGEISADVAWLQGLLAAAPEGTRVAVYCGFGGAMPPEYRCVASEAFEVESATLELWIREAGGQRGAFSARVAPKQGK